MQPVHRHCTVLHCHLHSPHAWLDRPHTLCCLQGLLVWNPFAKAPGSSQLVLETLVKAAQPLDGNSCPFNATNPLQGCPPGYFCPTAAEQVPCPRGYFCPGECVIHQHAGTRRFEPVQPVLSVA